MSYFEDLSDYTYFRVPFYRPGTKNVGWLDSAHEFPKAPPSRELLDFIWNCCKVSVAQSRGIHECDQCPSGTSNYIVRDGEPLLLGSAEIRVFGKAGVIYAAPTLVYHYVAVHQYRPPDEFVRSLEEGPRPPSQEYFERLKELDLEWNKTFAPVAKPRRVKFERKPGGPL
jgi:hypothetical protein